MTALQLVSCALVNGASTSAAHAQTLSNWCVASELPQMKNVSMIAVLHNSISHGKALGYLMWEECNLLYMYMYVTCIDHTCSYKMHYISLYMYI